MKWKKKKELTTVQKEYPIDCLTMFPLKIFTSTLLNCSFTIIKIYLTTEHIFVRIYWDREKRKIKEGEYDYCKLN